MAADSNNAAADVGIVVDIVGMHGGEWYGKTAESALGAADVLIGSQRLLDTIPVEFPGERLNLFGPLDQVIDEIEKRRANGERVAMLASGDPGFFGIERLLVGRFGQAIRVHPAPSSVSLAFARARIPWDDASVVSCHGRTLAQAVPLLTSAPKVAVLVQAVDRTLIRVDVPLGLGVGAFIIFTTILPFTLDKSPQDTAQLLAFASAAALQLGRSLWNLQAQLQNFLEHCGSLVESLELIEGDGEEPEELPDFVPISGEVRLEGVSFAYQGSAEQSVLNSLSLHVADRQSVGLVGFSGAGKSTLLSLLLGFERPTEGRVLFDGHDVNSHSRRSLRSHIAYVPQDPSLLHLSVAENIALGVAESSEAEIEQAARRANAFDFIQDLPSGMDTVVGERGVHLSGGQRQRIALARALLKPNTRLLLLDEATSSLDSWSETLVQDTLHELNGQLSLLVVAHRLSTVKNLDRILVLDHGRVVEDGPHIDLVDNSGIYSRLWDKQTIG